MGLRNSRVSNLRVEDANGLGMTVGPGEGNWSVDPMSYGNTAKQRVDDRGRFDCHVETTDLEQAWSIDTRMKIESITSAVSARLQDFLLKQGTFSAAVSVSSNPNIWAFVVKYTMTLGGVTTDYELPHNLADFSFSEAIDGHTVSLSGTNNGAVLIDGVAQTTN